MLRAKVPPSIYKEPLVTSNPISLNRYYKFYDLDLYSYVHAYRDPNFYNFYMGLMEVDAETGKKTHFAYYDPWIQITFRKYWGELANLVLSK